VKIVRAAPYQKVEDVLELPDRERSPEQPQAKPTSWTATDTEGAFNEGDDNNGIYK